jgi:hypothetical protein
VRQVLGTPGFAPTACSIIAAAAHGDGADGCHDGHAAG